MKVLPGTSPFTRTTDIDLDTAIAGVAAAASPRPAADGPRRSVPRHAGGVLLALTCIVAAWWYVPWVVGAHQRLLTGTVISTGIVDLNFGRDGAVSSVLVSLGAQVKRGELLATENAPAAQAAIRADEAASAADRAEIAQLRATLSTPAAIATARAQLAKDHASLAADRAVAAGARLTAPSAGTIVAINAKPGETASVNGVQDYATQMQGTPVSAQPPFFLLPEAPQANTRASTSAGQLPLIELRTSSAWEVVVLIPGNSAAGVRPGQAVTVSVPAAGLRAVRGQVNELPAANPVQTADGVAYEVVVTILGHRADPPLTGMTADVTLGT
jgi:urease beta subunit